MRSLSLTFLLLLSFLASAQTAWTEMSVDAAKNVARETGQLIILDFYASWCGPCNRMDEKVWSQPEVMAAQGQFVNVRVDVTGSPLAMNRYGLSAIPAVIVIDALGNEYARRKGYMGEMETLAFLADHTANLKEVYAVAPESPEEAQSFSVQFLMGSRYQEAARAATGYIVTELTASSDRALKKAKKLLAKQDNPPTNMKNRIGLLQAENWLLRGSAKKAIKAVQAVGDELADKNSALACYILSLAYRENGKEALANECYERLQAFTDNEHYLALYHSASSRK